MTTLSPLRSGGDHSDVHFDPDVGFGPDPEFAPAMFGDPFPASGAEEMFTAVPAIMEIFLTVLVIIMAVRLFQAGHTFATNSSLPTTTVAARVVAKRTHTEGGAHDTPVRTLYYATFQTADGERVEVKVPRRDYGQLADGDEGQLTHQGTWYRGFQRKPVAAVDEFWEAPGGHLHLKPPSTS